MKFNEFRALNARWLNLREAAFYCGYSIGNFNKVVRIHVTEDQASRPVMFDRERLDKVMESRQIGNLPSQRKGSPTSTAGKGASKRGFDS